LLIGQLLLLTERVGRHATGPQRASDYNTPADLSFLVAAAIETLFPNDAQRRLAHVQDQSFTPRGCLPSVSSEECPMIAASVTDRLSAALLSIPLLS
jgi:hypothetical protein